MKTKIKKPKVKGLPLKEPQRHRTIDGDPIVKKKMVGIRESLYKVIQEYRVRTPVDVTAAIHQLVLYGHRYPIAVEDWIAAEMVKTGLSRARIIERILWDYVQRGEAERAKSVSSVRAEETVARLIEDAKADVKPPAHEPQRK